jgi:hypothetical protein
MMRVSGTLQVNSKVITIRVMSQYIMNQEKMMKNYAE